MTFGMRMALAFGALVLVLLAATFEHPPIVFQQQGYRGTGMDELDPAGRLADFAAKVPEAQPPASAEGQKAGEVYENVQVLRDLSDEQFTRIMAAITDWVAPEQGCAYCHDDDGNFALDNKYTKIVARRMLQMTRHINTDWKTHVADTGVTCYTCHRGQPVPSYVWFTDTDASATRGMLGNRQGQNMPAPESGMSSLPSDPLTPYLASGGQIRVVGKAALPSHPGSGSSIKTTEETYGLMMHLSESLGVNCTYCHNSRSFSSWDQSNKPRLTAYRGIRMVRDLNSDFMAGLKPVWPANRLGPHGDFPKLDCSTCHQKQFKPLAGLGMLAANPELAVDDEAGLAPNAAASGGGAAPAGQPAPAGAETTPTDAAPAGTAPAAEPPAATPAAEPPAAAPAPAEAPVPAPAAQPETMAPAPSPGAAEAPAPAAQPEVAAPPPALDQPAGSAPPPAAAQPPATTTP